MPGQFFVDEHCRQVVLIRWDMGVKFIDIEFAGARLARLDGPDILLSTGMQGAAPDGNHLVVGATRESGPITFYVQHAGVYLTPEPVDYAMHPPVVEIIDALNSTGRAGASQAGLSMDSKGRLVKDGLVVDDTVLTYAAGARKVDHSAITKGRIHLTAAEALSVYDAMAAAGVAGLAPLEPRDVHPEGAQLPPALCRNGAGVLVRAAAPADGAG